MNKTLNNLFIALGIVLLATSCKSHQYEVEAVRYTALKVDAKYENNIPADLTSFMAPYKAKVDSMMTPVVGQVACDMDVYRPESKLSNLLADILVWAGKGFGENADMGLYNIGGIRASLSKGNVTIGDILDVAPFENKLCFMTLTGKQMTTLFEEMAGTGGEGVSHSARSVITKDGKLVSLTINGKAVDPNARYRLATIDYLSEGNDGMKVLKDGTDRRMLTDEKDNLRFLIMNYFREMAKSGKAVDSKVEGRIRYQK